MLVGGLYWSTASGYWKEKSNEYIDTFDAVRTGYKKLHTMGLDPIKIMHIAGVGKREVATILSCEDFNDMTAEGSVVVTENCGTFLKVTVNRFEAEGIRHDAGTGLRQCAD